MKQKEMPETLKIPVDAIKKIVDSEKMMRFASTFEQKVILMKQKKKLLDTIVKSIPEASHLASLYSNNLKQFQSETEKTELKSIKIESPLDSSMRCFESNISSISQILKNMQHQQQERKRHFYLDFWQGFGQGFFGDAPTITDVQNGIVGWRNLNQLKNDDTGKTIGGKLFLYWSLFVPYTGYYRFEATGASEFRANIDYKLNGNGLWGLDASLRIWLGSWLYISKPEERVYFSTEKVKETRYSAGHEHGSLNDWFPVMGQQEFFFLEEGAEVVYVIELDIDTWAEDGKVRVDVNSFYLPSCMPDMELRISD